MSTKKVIPDKKDKNQHRPIREGQENSSILNDGHPPDDETYPRPSEQDKQANNQPEFIDPESNRKEHDSTE